MLLAAPEAPPALEHVLLWLQVRFVVMGNVFPSDVKLHRRYDLKGSTFGRTAAKKASNPNTVLKVIQGQGGLAIQGACSRGFLLGPCRMAASKVGSCQHHAYLAVAHSFEPPQGGGWPQRD